MEENKMPELKEKVVAINRVAKVVKGGRTFRFSAVVIVGDGAGHVGVGNGKAAEVPDAIKKAIQAANKNVTKVALIDNRTISHEIIVKEGAVRVMLKPAAEGTGVKAGGPVRDVLELAGVKDVLSKSLGFKLKPLPENISENSSAQFAVTPRNNLNYTYSSSPDISSGDLEITAQVSIIFNTYL